MNNLLFLLLLGVLCAESESWKFFMGPFSFAAALPPPVGSSVFPLCFFSHGATIIDVAGVFEEGEREGAIDSIP